MQVLVIGGRGFVGSKVVRALSRLPRMDKAIDHCLGKGLTFMEVGAEPELLLGTYQRRR